MNARPACHFCGNCMAGCDVVAKYNSADVHIAPAEKSGPRHGVPRLHRPRGAGLEGEPRDRRALPAPRPPARRRGAGPRGGGRLRLRAERRAAADVDVGAVSRRASRTPAVSSAGTSFRISPAGSSACCDDLRGKAPDQRRGVSRSRATCRRSCTGTRTRGYARSFGAQFNYQNHRFAGWAKAMPGFGKAYKASVKAAYPAILDFTPYGEMLPNARFVCRSRSGAARQVRVAAGAAPRPMGQQRGKAVQRHGAVEPEDAGAGGRGDPDGPRGPGHQPRAWRLPHGPRTRARRSSTADCRTHDVPNLYVVDGSVFPSASEKNPDPHDHGARGASRRSHRGPHEER